jgi:OMF family outer membrane factor
MRHHATVERKDPYANEKQKQLQPTPISPEPVVKRKEELEIVPYQSQEDKQQENLLPLTRPSLKALISVDRHLDPFGLESTYSEEVGLRDVLKAAMGGNLDIMNVQANERAQKYTYLSAFSKFLPDTIMGYNLYYVDGSIVLPGGFGGGGGAASTSKINSGFTLMNAALRYRMYQGGAVLFGELAAKHQWRAAKAQVVGNVNDVLLDSARRYYDLLRQQALLHIRIRAVDTSTEQLRRNTDLEANGLATNLDILQARTQLARDRQNLVDQQSQRRNAAILLAQTLNSSLGQDLIPSDKVVGKMRLIAKETQIADLLKLAIDNRPELKQYDELRQAAKAQIMVALAPLHPQVALTTSTYGVGTLSQLGALLNIGFGVNWTLGGMGLTDSYNAQTAKYRTRQALVRANQEFVNVFAQVRTAYVNMLSSEQRIEETTDEVYSAQEELRLSRLRLDSGLGTNLDVLTAQRDLTQAYIDKVEAIINFNVAQVQLVHDIGLISVDTLTSNRPLTISAPAKH